MSDQGTENQNLLDEGVPTDAARSENLPTDPDATDPNPDISTEEIDPEEAVE